MSCTAWQERKLHKEAREGTAAFQAALAQYMGTSDATPADAAGLVDALGAHQQ